MAVTQGIDADGNLIKNDSYYNSTGSSKTANNSLDKSAFLNLLVAEMKYQDPLNPSSNTDYVAQLATFSQVESMQNMQLTYQQQQAAGLTGRPVIMRTESASGETGYVCGVVEYMVTKDSKVYLSINGSLYDIDDLDTVLTDDYYNDVVLANKNNGSSVTDKVPTTGKDDNDDKDDTEVDEEK